jgi:hypothetical protein
MAPRVVADLAGTRLLAYRLRSVRGAAADVEEGRPCMKPVQRSDESQSVGLGPSSNVGATLRPTFPPQ